MQSTTRQILVGSRRLARRGDHRSGSGQAKPGLPLAASLDAKVEVLANSVRGRVGSSKRYAASEHQGSKAHVISGRGKMLKFRWERGEFLVQARRRGRRGTFFFFATVRHPGNKRPVRYLTTPLVQFGRANGFRVVTAPVSRSFLP